MTTPSLSFESFIRVRSATGGVFSPDGRCLAYLLNTPGTPQVFRQDSPGPVAVQLSNRDGIARAIHWSPSGELLAFTMDQGGSEREQIYVMLPDGREQRCITNFPEAIHHFGCWSPDGKQIAFASNRRDPAFFDLYVSDVATGADRCVLQQDRYLTVADWSPDGLQLLVQELQSNSDHNLHVLNLETGELRLVTPHQGEARFESARFLPDNRSVLLCTDQGHDFLALARLDTKMCRMRTLLDRRADVESCDLAADGKRLVALLNRDGWSEVVIARLDDRILRGLVSVRLPGVASGCRISANGSRIALSMNSPTANPDVWSMDPETTARTRWTRAPLGDLTGVKLVEPKAIEYRSHDGLEIPALLYRPAGAPDGPLPTIVHIHGGPEGQDRPNFSPVYQYLVHRGYAVLAPNVRGSTGYGNAYCHLDDREKRYDAIRDVEYAHRWLVSSGTAAANCIGIMGGSYGGFMVLACLTRQPELWAVGVDIVGIANFETFFQHTGPWRRQLRAREYGDPVTDAKLLRDLSPIHAVDKIRAPLIVIQGANDPRVPQVESDQMVEQLRERGQPVEYLLFEDEGHGIVKVENRIKAYTAIAEYLDRYLLS